GFGRSFAEEAGAEAGRWFIDSLREPHASTPLGPIRPPVSVEGYRADGYALLREQLDPGRMRARAAALRSEADALVRPPLDEGGGEAAEEAMAARLERGAALRGEAERLLRRADRVEPLLAEPMRPEVLQALEEILLEDEPVSPPPESPAAAEPTSTAPSAGTGPGPMATAGSGGAAHSAFHAGRTTPPPPTPAPSKKRSWLTRIVDWFTGRSGTGDAAAVPDAAAYEPPDFAFVEDDPWMAPDPAADFGDAAEEPGPAEAAPSVAPRLADVPVPPILPTMFALLGGNPSPMLVIEWLRWFAEFGAVLQGAVEEARWMERDLNDLAAWYRAERDRALRELAVHGAFAHRVLSRPYLDLLFRQRGDALLAAFTPRLRETLRERFGSEAEGGDTPSLMDFMHPGTPERSGLQRAVNHRFLGVDDDLEAAAREVFADWVEARLEPVLMDDPLVEGGGRPRDRLRALSDAARPLARPGIPPAPAAAEMALLPAGAESGPLADALAEVAPSAQTVVTPDAERLSLRTVLHAYPAFALPQLRPVREASVHTAGGAPPYDPLPREALVRTDQDQVIAVGLAFGRVRRTEGGPALDPLPAERDEAVLVHRLSTTFAGWDAYQRLRGDLARELRAPDAVHRLRGVLEEEGDGYSPEHRASLQAVAAALESGGWPDAFPFPDDA
ncbi:MAG TPA: hypothetical protein VGX50_15010, partial [Longimicrobium sp.]|nr:hypothetical protein [Longimicrobium sp.]